MRAMLISLDLFAVLLGGAVALMPIFAETVLHTGPRGLGLLRAMPSLGKPTKYEVRDGRY